jgi:hypothetical protein
LAGHFGGIIASFGFGGRDSAEAVHEALLVVPASPAEEPKITEALLDTLAYAA